MADKMIAIDQFLASSYHLCSTSWILQVPSAHDQDMISTKGIYVVEVAVVEGSVVEMKKNQRQVGCQHCDSSMLKVLTENHGVLVLVAHVEAVLIDPKKPLHLQLLEYLVGEN